MAELHLIGQIHSLDIYDLPRSNSSFYCDYRLVFSEGWSHLEGSFAGRTQQSRDSIEPQAIWNYPLDSHLITKTFQNWPRLVFEVWRTDALRRSEIFGYGCINLPCKAGCHRLSIPIWRPVGCNLEELQRQFLGGGYEITSFDALLHGAERYKLQTTGSGCIRLDISIILRNLNKFGVRTS